MRMYMLKIETFIQLHANEIKKLMIEIFFFLNNAISACQDNMVVVELKAYI